MVYASNFAYCEKRLKNVNIAAKKMAKMLGLDVKVITFREKTTVIYVYYQNGNEEPVPIYCDKGKGNNVQDIYTNLRKMLFVLSFHPKHSALKKIRKEIIRFF